MIGNKYFCFNIREFEVLLSAFEIQSLPRFKYEEQLNPQYAQMDYNIGVFDLYKSGAISQENGCWKVDSEIGDIFKILKETKYYITIICKNEEVPEYLLYISDTHQFVVAQPGNQNGEYMKMQLFHYEDLSVFLEESGALLSDIIMDNFVENQEFLPVEDEVKDFISKDMKTDEESLLSLKNIETIITVTNRDSLEKTAVIGILKQTLQDKLILWTQDEKRLDLYSNNKIVEMMKLILEGKKDDIG